LVPVLETITNHAKFSMYVDPCKWWPLRYSQTMVGDIMLDSRLLKLFMVLNI
jgi:hypothetical protein